MYEGQEKTAIQNGSKHGMKKQRNSKKNKIKTTVKQQ